MKLTTFLIVIALVQASAKSFSQQITLHETNAPLTRVINAIKQQSGYQFLYTDNALKKEKLTVAVNNADIEETLRACFGHSGIDYKIIGKSVLLKRTERTVIATAVDVVVRGKVVDEQGDPLPGATVRQKDQSGNGTMTDAKGDFRLTVGEENAVVVFSFTGYETVELRAKDIASGSSVTLKASTTNLKEVVVNKGYYTEKQILSTGNVTKISGEDIAKQPVSDPLLALSGRVPGLYISQASGIPGSYANIQLRGQNFLPPTSRAQYVPSLNNPLFIIDGVPFNSASSTISAIGGGAIGSPGLGNNAGLSPFNNLNPSDIESIEVLKDADATAIYGSRGANGVILITTKKGKAGKTQFNLDYSTGTGTVARMIPLMNTRQYLEMRREAFTNDGKSPGVTDLDVNGTWDQSSYTDWQKMFIGGSANFTNLQGSLTGGNDKTQYFIAGGYSKQTTVFPGNYADKKSFVNFNIDHRSDNNKFHTLFSGGYTIDNNQLPFADLTQSITIAPNAPSLMDNNGNLNWNIPFNNPLAYTKQSASAVSNNLISNLSMDYMIRPGLHGKVSFGYTSTTLNQTNIFPAIANAPPYSTDPSFRTNDWGTNRAESWIAEPQLSYTKSFGKSKLNLLLGATFQENVQSIVAQQATGFSSDDLINNIALASSISVRGNTNVKYRYNAIYGRINYNFQDKYLLNITLRRDGSSRFGPDKKFGNFGAIGTGWLFSQENFVKNALPFLSFGKLRGSYGLTGNDQIPDYQYLSTYQGYSTSNYQGVTGLYPNLIANPYFSWQTVKKLEAAMELGLFNDRLFISASYYRNRTNDQLVAFALPTTAGFNSIFSNLPAVVQNTGVELAVNTTNIKGADFRWNSSINLTAPRNKLVAYPNIASSAYATKYQVGQSLNIQYLYHSLGIDPQTGIYQIEDLDKNNVINTNDKQFQKQVAQDYYGGFLNSFSYRKFQLDILFQFVKQTGYSSGRYFTEPGDFYSGSGNQPTYVLNRWQKIGDISAVQKYTQQPGAVYTAWQNALAANGGDASIIDASFIRLKNVSLSYQLPSRWLEKAAITNFRVYIQAQNLMTITNYKGLDPETQGLALPPLRMISLGGQISF